VQAKGRKILKEEIRPAQYKIQYSPIRNKKSITNMLDTVLKQLKYGSLVSKHRSNIMGSADMMMLNNMILY
jgi:hypothetical protein